MDQEFSVDKLSVKELKEILQERNIDYADCFEKSDLIRKVKSIGITEKPKAKPTIKTTQISTLDCILVDNCGEANPELVTMTISIITLDIGDRDVSWFWRE
jgi:hypothetical protein